MRLGHFDLNLLVAFDALLDTCSITQAGKRLNIGASATSGALGRLREHFGDELLVQVGRRMQPTPLAQELRQPIRDLLLRSHATLAMTANFDPLTAKRHFVINASDYSATILLVPLARALEREAPQISMDIVSLGSDNLNLLQRGEIDLAIYPSAIASAEHPQEPLFTETYSCIVWEGSRLARHELTFDAYMAADHVAVNLGDRRVSSFESWFGSAFSVERKVAVAASTFNILPMLIVDTERIGTMFTRLARMHARMIPLRVLQPPFAIPDFVEVMQWNRHRELDAAHVWLRRRIKALADEGASEPADPGGS